MNRLRLISPIFVFVAVVIGHAAIAAPSVTLAWNANSETNLAGYRLYWGPAARTYGQNQTVPVPTTIATVTNLVPTKTYFFAVTAYTTDGLESDYSDEVSYTVPPPRPVAPRDLRIVTSLQASQSPSGPWTNLWTMSQPVPAMPAKSPLDLPVDGGWFYRSQSQLTE
jgi:hypothetical protein